MFVRALSGTRTLCASSSMLISDFTCLVSQPTAVPETSFYLTFQGTLLQCDHTGQRRSCGHEGSSLWWSQQGVIVSAVP